MKSGNTHSHRRGFWQLLLLLFIFNGHAAYAEPTVIETDPNTGKPIASAQPLEQTEQTIQNNTPTLASLQQPSESELSKANQELLTHNAQLQREINDLQTQVNVLVNERSGQLFLYGAITTIIAFLAGVMITTFFFRKKDRW